jgi:hypothetical protein
LRSGEILDRLDFHELDSCKRRMGRPISLECCEMRGAGIGILGDASIARGATVSASVSAALTSKTHERDKADTRHCQVGRGGAKHMNSIIKIFLAARLGVVLFLPGYLARGGQIIDATIVSAPKQHNSREDNETIKEGETPEDWKSKPAKKSSHQHEKPAATSGSLDERPR